ncbi:hypothetical protein VULLAG_LOCUS4344 [Vulpes lagopus]
MALSHPGHYTLLLWASADFFLIYVDSIRAQKLSQSLNECSPVLCCCPVGQNKIELEPSGCRGMMQLLGIKFSTPGHPEQGVGGDLEEASGWKVDIPQSRRF